MKHFFILLLLGIMLPRIAFSQTNEMPIIGFMGVPESKSSYENFRRMKECGFNVSINQYSSSKALLASCRTAQKAGIRILGNCPELKKSPKATVSQLMAENGFFGYYLADEPTAPQIRQIGDQIKAIKAIDSKHVCYFNLLPYENPDWVQGNTKVKTYEEYLSIASSTNAQQISFDHYPIKTTGICDTWYKNLELVRQESLKSKKPFWGFVMSVPHWHYPQPTLGSLRLQAFVNLAYGAQAIQYFTYWTPKASTEGFNYRNGPVDNNGNVTKTYSLVQSVNKDLQQISKLFYGAQVLSVYHLGKISLGATRITKNPKNITSLKIVSKKGAVISQFKKGTNNYLAIVNKDYEEDISVLIKAKNNVKHITPKLEEETMQSKYTLSPGNIVLFKLD